MAARRVIGVDLGGTKLLGGVVDPSYGVHHRTQRNVAGLDQRALLEVTVDAVAECREAAGGEPEAVGFGLPVLVDRRAPGGLAAVGVNTPLRDLRFGDVMAERLGLPVFVDNDGNTSALAEHRAGAAAGCTEAVIITLGTGIAGGLILRDELYRGAFGAAGELGHMVIELDGPRCHGNCPNHGCAEVYCSGTALVEEARRLGAIRPGSGLERLARETTLAGPLVTELAHDGDPAAREAIALIGERLGVVIANVLNIFNPEVVVIGGGVIAAGELLLAPARAVVAERVLPVLRDGVPIRAAHFGVEAGMVGAAALAYDEIARRAIAGGAMTTLAALSGRAGRLVVCPTPIGNLEDVTLRVLAALRDADVIACEDTRRTGTLLERYAVEGPLVSYHEHNERARTEELVGRMRAGETVALVSDAGMPLVSDPGLVLVQACVAAGLEVEVLPGPSAALSALVASGLAADHWRFVGFLPRKRGELETVLASPETLVCFESPRRLAASLAVLAERDGIREVAVCRELTKLHEEIVRGTAAELAARYAEQGPRGEIVLVIGPGTRVESDLEVPVAALRRLVDAGAKPRTAASVVAELTGTSANALYRALTAARG